MAILHVAPPVHYSDETVIGFESSVCIALICSSRHLLWPQEGAKYAHRTIDRGSCSTYFGLECDIEYNFFEAMKLHNSSPEHEYAGPQGKLPLSKLSLTLSVLCRKT